MPSAGNQFSRINLDPSTRTTVRRLRNIYRATPDDVRSAGLHWYGNVHDAAMKSAHEYGRSPAQAAAIVSAVSPNMDFERNNIHAFHEIHNMTGAQWGAIERSAATPGKRTQEAKDALKGVSIAPANDKALLKARDIWHGHLDPYEAFNPKKAPKTHTFFHNILTPHEDRGVTVDGRHADLVTDAMRPWGMGRQLGGKGVRNGSRYDRYEHATRLAAQHEGVLPHEMQAVTWEHGKQIERGYDPSRKKGDSRTGQSYQSRLTEFQSGHGLG